MLLLSRQFIKIVVSINLPHSRVYSMMVVVPQGLNSKHLAAGSEYPALEPGKLRIYNMRFCPYAERTMLTLLAKGIEFEVVNVNLVSKPDWFLTKNPMGKVPTLERDGQIVYESGVCNEYLDDAGIGKDLAPADPLQKAHQKMLVERLSKLTGSFYGAVRAPDDEAKVAALNEALDFTEQMLEHDYFSGSTCGCVDYMIWPWIERMSVVPSITQGKIKIDKVRHPKLTAYVERMMAVPEIKLYALDAETHMKFLTSYKSGKPDYDILAAQ